MTCCLEAARAVFETPLLMSIARGRVVPVLTTNAAHHGQREEGLRSEEGLSEEVP